ncbi:MAG: hypothetical protein DCC58_03870 [Chloroflexi bacterium]|nr:MAG: hypothetical protein DCC58_03870 [Chloroflexota bacterium]
MTEKHTKDYLPAWCERRRESRDGRYVVACYFTRDGHPVPKARAERIQLTEYDIEGTPLRVEEGIVRPAPVQARPAAPSAILRVLR